MSLVLGSQDCALASSSPILRVPLGLSPLQGAMLSWGPPWRGEGLVSGCSPGWTILQLEGKRKAELCGVLGASQGQQLCRKQHWFN